MKELLQQYAAYNIWATKLLTDSIGKLSDEEIHREITNSFPSLYKTMQHIWVAEEVWWLRLKLVDNIVLQSDKFTGSFKELTELLTKQNQQWGEWVNAATENQLTHVFAYIRKNS